MAVKPRQPRRVSAFVKGGVAEVVKGGAGTLRSIARALEDGELLLAAPAGVPTDDGHLPPGGVFVQSMVGSLRFQASVLDQAAEETLEL